MKILPLTESEVRRFQTGVDRREPNECWLWKRSRSATGRIAFALATGKEPLHREIAALYGVSKSEVSMIAGRVVWKCLPPTR